MVDSKEHPPQTRSGATGQLEVDICASISRHINRRFSETSQMVISKLDQQSNTHFAQTLNTPPAASMTPGDCQTLLRVCQGGKGTPLFSLMSLFGSIVGPFSS